MGDLAATREEGISWKRQVMEDWAARWDRCLDVYITHIPTSYGFDFKGTKTMCFGVFPKWEVESLS